MFPVIETIPHNLSTWAGRTRNTLNLNRWWQKDIKLNRAKCPFHKPEQVIRNFPEDGGWNIMEDFATPSPHHLLITPLNCWTKQELRILGGWKKIARALCIANSLHTKGEWYVGVHVGPHAGQNQPHLHWHALVTGNRNKPDSRAETALRKYCTTGARKVLESETFAAYAGGVRAGQCFIFPQKRQKAFDGVQAADLGKLIFSLLMLCNEKFRSVQGLPPDFQIGIKFVNGSFRYGFYLPTLNHWGYTEYFGLLEGLPLWLPWTHDLTAKHLRSIPC